MFSKHSFNLLKENEKNAIFNEFKDQWHLHYFLDIAWLTKRHIHQISRSDNSLVLRRTSGAGHWIKGDAQFFLQQLSEGPLLLHESLIPEGLDLAEIQCKPTSYLMEASYNTYSTESLSLLGKIVHLKDLDHQSVHHLYKTHMGGSLSVSDFIQLERLGSYSVGYAINNDIVAVGHVGISHNGCAFVYGILVHPDYRGSGLGKCIMLALHREAHARGWNLFLLTDNPIAIQLYSGLGYKLKGQMLKVERVDN